ncbi:MAG: PHP domain-containing protein [Treponema sp.]|nr:PHP domain-containing protein [Treponema sp.]
MIDLHTHSNISDGEFSPDQLIKEAASLGLRAIALTDHDTINGLESARKTAVAENLYFIPGIEINISWSGGKGLPGIGPGGEFHLLGLGINSPGQGLIAAVDRLFHSREARSREILDRMHELSIDATWEELLAVAEHGMAEDTSASGGKSSKEAIERSLGRPHFAALLVKKKIVKNANQAFIRYLGAGKPLYVPKKGLTFDEAVSVIRESGGIPVLAHPISLFIAWGRLPDLVKSLKDRGLMGIEAWHPTAKPGACRRLEALGKSLGLYITEGSDFHGYVRPDRKLGYSSAGRKIDDAILEAIPELANMNLC